MPFMVVFRSPEGGKPGYHQTEVLEDAVKFVERLRNQENVTEARIFRMQEVAIEFKTYYRVEINANGEGPEAQPLEDDSEAPTEPAAAGAGRFSRFGK
jgi:hypothetical protein